MKLYIIIIAAILSANLISYSYKWLKWQWWDKKKLNLSRNHFVPPSKDELEAEEEKQAEQLARVLKKTQNKMDSDPENLL